MNSVIRFLLFCLFLHLTACAAGTRYTIDEADDFFKFAGNKDRNFTQGLNLAAEIPDDTRSIRYSIGQNFYTPGNKQLTAPQPADRPYAGYLYAGTDLVYRTSPTVRDTVGAQLGVVGPHAYGEQVQNGFHRLIGDQTAKGWSNQLHDEPALVLTAQRDYAAPLEDYFDIITTVGGSAGNVFTQGFSGVVFRLGTNLPDYFHTGDIIYPRLPRSAIFNNKWSTYVFGGPSGRAVLRNIFLDGNTFRDSLSVDKKPLVAEGRIGVALEYGLWSFKYTYVAHTHEFVGERPHTDFGEITLSAGW